MPVIDGIPCLINQGFHYQSDTINERVDETILDKKKKPMENPPSILLLAHDTPPHLHVSWVL
jgi:hypothetical protein